MTSARPPERRSTVAKSSNTFTGSAVVRIVTALASRSFLVTCAIPASTTGIAQVTRKLRLASAVTILTTADPVKVFEDFATVDLLSGGRAEVIAGRGVF